jgi:hypothetical protein
MARHAVSEPDWFEAERDQFIDDYLREHPDATEFEAALMWAIDATDTTPPKDYSNANL